MNWYAVDTCCCRPPATSSMKSVVMRSATSIAILGSRCSNSIVNASLPFTVTVIALRMRSIVSMSGSLPSEP